MSKQARFQCAGAVGIAVLLLLSAVTGFGQTRRQAPEASPKGNRQRMDEQVYAQLTKAWASFYDGKNEDAVNQADPLLKLADPRYRWVAIEAAHIQARGYWAHGGRGGQAKAQQLWKQLEKLSTLNSLQMRLKIAQALELEAAGDEVKRNQAIALLEQVLKDRQMNTATPEAGIDLARLYVQARRFDDAEKTLKFVIDLLGDKRTPIRMELPDKAMVQPYVKAAEAALGRLKYERDAGRERFEAAEKLRKRKKWMPAARAYQAIVKDFDETDYAPRSDLHIGDCLIGLGRQAQAVAHWKKFIEPLPAGPYRAQAYVKIIDYCLEEQLDLPEAGKYAGLARSSLPTALADEEAGPSWKACEYDIAIRIGLVSLITGKGEDAVTAFTEAKQLTGKKTVAESLDALIAAAKSSKGVIPDDVKGGGAASAAAASSADKVALALSMGVIHLVAGRLDNAEAFFNRVTGEPSSKDARNRPPLPGGTAAQHAFATFGKGAVSHARRKEAEAKDAFLASIKAFNSGSWHDESLYRVATITQDAASAKFAEAAEPAAKPGRPARPPTPQEREAAAKAEKERLAALVKAKGEALPCWQELIKRYPSSPRCEQAYYQAGVLLCEIAAPAPAAQSEKMWKDAAFMLNRFCAFYPKSPWAGDAILRQTDIAMERLFDLALARTTAEQGVNWAKGASERTGGKDVESLPPWAIGVAEHQPPSLKEVLYDCYLRAGLVAYLEQKYDQAASMFKAADEVGCARPYRVVQGTLPTGMERLIAAAQKGTPLTPPEVLKGDSKPSMILGLGDLYFAAEQWEKSRALYHLVYDQQVRPITPLQTSWAAFMIARTHFWKFEFAEAQQFYHVVFEKYPQSPWAATALFYNATMAYSNLRDMKEASACLDQIRKNYPRDEMAERAAYLIGQLYQWRREFDKAKAAFAAYLKDYPNGMYAKGIKETLLPEVEKGLSGLEKTARH